jgi:hypothetical protein
MDERAERCFMRSRLEEGLVELCGEAMVAV